jgi:small-conductance mechanosensitive channel
MSRRGQRVPEAAPLVGLVLAFSVALFGYLFAPPQTLLPIFLLALLSVYGFTAYAIVRSPDPAAVIPPDIVLAAGFLVAGLLCGYGLVVAGQPMFGLFVGLVAGTLPALYHARYGERVNPLDADGTFTAALAVAAIVLVVGGPVVGDPAMAVLDAVVVVLAAADYRDVRGTPLSDLAEFTLVAATLGGAALAVIYFSFVAADPVLGLLVGGSLLAVGAFFAIGDW